MKKATWPADRKAFRDNYLAALMIGLALFFSNVASAQYDSTKQRQAVNGYGFDWKNGKFGNLVLPSDTPKLAVKDSGAIAWKSGNIWGWSGYIWKLSSGTGGGIDTLYSRGDSAFYLKDSIEHFAFILGIGGSDSAIAGRNGVKVAVVGTTRYLDADSAYVATRARLQKSLDSVNLLLLHWTDTAGNISTRQYRQKLADSLGLVKVTNFSGSTFLGYGTYAAKPTSGSGFYYAQDSARLAYITSGVLAWITDVAGKTANIYFRGKGQPGDTSYVYGRDSTIWVRAKRDSLGHHHTVLADSSEVDWSLDSTGANALQTKYRSDTARIRQDAAIASKVNITDTANKWLNRIYRSGDSVYQCKGSTCVLAFMDSLGSGGGTSTPDSIQVITSGSTATISNGVNIVYIDPSSTLSSLVITLPATPHATKKITFFIGGTLTTGAVVTSLSFVANTGQSLLQASVPSTVYAGDFAISYKERVSNTKWYREN